MMTMMMRIIITIMISIKININNSVELLSFDMLSLFNDNGGSFVLLAVAAGNTDLFFFN